MLKINIKYRWLLYHAIALSLVGVGYVALAGEGRYGEWLKNNIDEDEKILCEREIGGDYFFVAKKGGEIKTGSLIDVDGGGGGPKQFIISWQFVDQNQSYLELKVPPRDIKQSYVKTEGKLYAENVSYRQIPLNGVDDMFVSIKLKKYADQSDMPGSLSELEKRGGIDKVLICSVHTPSR